VLEAILDLERRGVRIAVATVVETVGSVPGKLGARMIVTADGRGLGTVGGAGLEEKVKVLARAALASGRGGLHRFELARQKPGGLDSICGGSVAIFIEIMNPRPHLVLFGGGHVGLAVARLCDLVEYRYTVVDDRPDYASRERFPRAVETVAGHAAEFFLRRDLTPYSHLYVLGYSHHEDEGTLVHALKSFPGRIGLIGSRSKRTDLRTRLVAQGIEEAVFDQRVICPIGLSIGAETPAEIAVAILGEVIQDFRSGSPSKRQATSTSVGSTALHQPEDQNDR
jgi:xanthine dehydrogenase accessory factor